MNQAQLAEAIKDLEKARAEIEEDKKLLIAEPQKLAKESQELYATKQKLTQTNPGMASSGMKGSMEQFSEDEDWTEWQERLEQYFIANDIQDNKKVALLLTLIGKKGYSLLRSLCMPNLPSTKKFEELTVLMKAHLQPLPSEITERYKFKKCVQSESENVMVFSANLKHLPINCAFGTDLSKNLRDQFVWSVRSESIKKRLLGEKDLTFNKALEIAAAMEVASKDAEGMNLLTTGNAASNVNFIRDKKQGFSKKTQPTSKDGERLSDHEVEALLKDCMDPEDEDGFIPYTPFVKKLMA